MKQYKLQKSLLLTVAPAALIACLKSTHLWVSRRYAAVPANQQRSDRR